MALVAYVNREERRIELDPAVRVGARLDAKGEALLLHTTSWGHCGETADALARVMRKEGWTVCIRSFDEFAGLATRLPTLDITAAAAAMLGGSVVETPPAIVSGRRNRNRKRQRCRTCGHLTIGKGVRSHVTNLGHDDWETVTVNADGTVAPAQGQV